MADKVSTYASAARAAGMSYGKYMAMMQGKQKPEPEPERYPSGKKACVVCGKIFYSTGNRICCSRNCSYERSLEKARQRERKKYEERKAQNGQRNM